MLLQLHIENIAVIASADLSFQSGFHALTGETGAGKSMIIDALNMILGERVSKDLIRAGAEKAYVEALFETDHPEVCQLLLEVGIPFSGELLISKELSSLGKSVCRINNRMVTAAFLREVGSYLVNIHGQFDNQMLFRPRFHYRYLDDFAEIDLSEYQAIYHDVQAIHKKLSAFDIQSESVREEFERLQYEIEEIENANLSVGEEEEIRKRIDTLEHVEHIMQSLSEARHYLYETEAGRSVYDDLGKALHALSSAERYDTSFEPLKERVQSLLPEIEELVGDLNTLSENISLDQNEITELYQRLNLIQHLKRKYGNDIESVLKNLERKKSKYNDLEHADEKYAALNAEYQEKLNKLEKMAMQISKKRSTFALRLQQEITEQLQYLDMKGSTFAVSLNPLEQLSSFGAESVEFLITTEPQGAPKPLVKIASGGEMSRTMLAIQVVLNKSEPVDTLVFDEIDAGVSGRAAQKIAKKLCEISRTKQILCITHLPQLAVMADVHFLIEKEIGDCVTTSVSVLDGEGRVDEIARILSGENVTPLTRKNAAEMLEMADAEKKEQNS